MQSISTSSSGCNIPTVCRNITSRGRYGNCILEHVKHVYVYIPVLNVHQNMKMYMYVSSKIAYYSTDIKYILFFCPSAILFLHEIGSIVHFTDHLNGLNDLYFIDPVWLACTLQRVTALPIGSLKGGKVHVETLRELSKKSSIEEDKFEQYLQLLARFEIVVPISHHW